MSTVDQTSFGVWDGRFVMYRRCTTPEFRARLIHTARILSTIDLPTVETFITLLDDGATTTLITSFAGGRSIATHPPGHDFTIASAGIALIDTLSALHRCGVTHGPIAAHDIRFGPSDPGPCPAGPSSCDSPAGRQSRDRPGTATTIHPILCGFGAAEVHPLDRPDSWLSAREADVRSLGQLLHELASHPAESGRGTRTGTHHGLGHRPHHTLGHLRLIRTTRSIAEGTLVDPREISRSLELVLPRRDRRAQRATGRGDQALIDPGEITDRIGATERSRHPTVGSSTQPE